MQHNNFRKVFSDRIQKLMIDNNLTIIQFAAKTQISRATISNWLDQNNVNRKLYGFENLLKLVKYFECSVDYLFGLGDRFEE